MSALFDFKAFLTVVLLTICTCTYIKAKFSSLLNDRTGSEGCSGRRLGLVSSLQVHLLPMHAHCQAPKHL